MTSDELKERVAEIIKGHKTKVWLTRVSGHRLDFIWSVGSSQMVQEQPIGQNGVYVIWGQSVPDELQDDILNVFNFFCSGKEANNKPDPGRVIRFNWS